MKRLLCFIMLLSTVAYGKKTERDGINFGTQMRVLSQEQQSVAEGSEVDQTTTSLAINPFVGYAFGGMFNLGLSLTGESLTVEEKKIDPASNTTSLSSSQSALKGTSVFIKLLFARVMFMEVGGGIYQVSILHNSSSISGSDSFSGSSQSSKSNGIGQGYHFGGGLEVPMGVGFYFTSALFWREVQLKDYSNQSSVTSLVNVKNELQFGITHYLQN